MKKILNIVLLLVAWMAAGDKSVAQTTVLGSLSDKYVNSLCVYNDTLFAACSDGLYMKDLCKNDAWKVIAFEDRHITSMVKRGDDILAILWLRPSVSFRLPLRRLPRLPQGK